LTSTRYGPPLDPAYVRFEEGLKEVAGKIDTVRRWHGRAQEWRSFDSANWIIDESHHLADTSPSSALSSKKFNPDRYEVISDASLLFAAIQAAQTSILARHPNVQHPVWTPWGDGDWRIAIPRNQPPPGTGSGGGLSEEARRRIKAIEDDVRAGKIPAATGDQLIAEIYRQWAVGGTGG
jgi:hypothetical protein